MKTSLDPPPRLQALQGQSPLSFNLNYPLTGWEPGRLTLFLTNNELREKKNCGGKSRPATLANQKLRRAGC